MFMDVENDDCDDDDWTRIERDDGDWTRMSDDDDDYEDENQDEPEDGRNAKRARLVRVLPRGGASFLVPPGMRGWLHSEKQPGHQESKDVNIGMANGDSLTTVVPLASKLATAPPAEPPAATPAEAEAPAPAPAAQKRRGGRGAARCTSRAPYNTPAWCANCKTLAAMTIKPRGVAQSFPCTGLQLEAEAPPPPPLTELSRAPAKRNTLTLTEDIRSRGTGLRLTKPERSRNGDAAVPAGIDAAFAKGAASKIYSDLAANAPNNDDGFVSTHVRPVIQRLVNEAAAAKQSAREANAVALAARTAETHAKRLLTKVLNDDKRLARHKPIIEQLIGRGFDSDRSLREHAADWVQKIEVAYAGDTWKQMQLAGALAERLALRKAVFERPSDQKVVTAVISSLQAYYRALRERHAGRYPNDVRAAKMGVDQAVAIAVDDCPASLTAIASLLGADRHALSDASTRWLAWCNGDENLLVAFRGRLRKDKTPTEWAEFVRRAWLTEEVTRAAESSHDSIRNPHDKRDKEDHRIHWLEMRKGDAVTKIQQLARAEFNAESTYLDGSKRPDGFQLSYKIIMFLMPFQVKQVGRHVCLCRYHLQWQYMVEGYYNYRVTLRRVSRDAERDCKCELTSNPYDFRRLRVCRDRDDGRFDNRKCMLRTCGECSKQPILCDKEKLPESHEQNKASWNAWRKAEYERKDHTKKTTFDFVRTSGTWQELDKEMQEYEPDFFLHHDLWKWQEDDISHLKSNFPRGTFWSVQDFSENGDLHPRDEHQGRYYNEISYTLYGAICRFWIDDLKPEIFGGAEAQSKLKEFLLQKGLRPIVQISHIVVSTDLNHDPPFVMHVNENILVKWAQSMAAPGIRIDTHYATSDGAPTQFDNADMYLWISKQSQKHGIRFDWTLTCSCHGKAESDPECGTVKNLIWRLLLDGVEIQTVAQAFQAMVDNAEFPKQSLFDKGGKGVFRRYFHFIPVRGATAINRRIQHCNTVTGSKPHRSFVDIGVPGVVWMARRSCHQCAGCMSMDHKECNNKKYQLTKEGKDDPGGLVLLDPKKGGSARAVTRGYLSTLGRSIASDLKMDQPNIVVVDMNAESEAWAIGVAMAGEDIHHVTEGDAHEYPDNEPGDEVLAVRKYEPIAPGSSAFDLTTKVFFVETADLRAVLSDSEFSLQKKMATRSGTRRQLSADAKQRILRLIPTIGL